MSKQHILFTEGVLQMLNCLHWKVGKDIVLQNYGSDVLSVKGIKAVVVWDEKKEKYTTVPK